MDSHAELHSLVSRDEIAGNVGRLAAAITGDYRDRNPLLLGILKGCFVFMADLVRRLEFPLEVEFVQLSSYGSGQETSGRVEVVQGLRAEIQGRDVLIVEDIVDTGVTLAFFINYLKAHGPASLRLCALADKPSRRRVPVDIHYLGFTVPDKFLVGYGLDCDEQYRKLPEICCLEEKCPSE